MKLYSIFCSKGNPLMYHEMSQGLFTVTHIQRRDHFVLGKVINLLYDACPISV